MKNIQRIVSVFLFLVLCGCGVAAGFAPTADTESSDSVIRRTLTSQLRGSASLTDASETAQNCPQAQLATPETVDEDSDGVPAGIDCADYDPYTYPGAYELCDYQDNDCNGETDENWKELFGDVFGKPCTALGANGCVSDGVWGCDFSRDEIVCNAPPIKPTTEKCNGVDDDCNGVTDSDAWPELGEICFSTKENCTRSGVWACDNYMQDSYCTAEDMPTSPENCNPDGGN